MLAESKSCEVNTTKRDKKKRIPKLSTMQLKDNLQSLNWKGLQKVWMSLHSWVCLWLKINGLSVTQQNGRHSRQRKTPLCPEKKQQRNNCGWKVHNMWVLKWQKFLYFSNASNLSCVRKPHTTFQRRCCRGLFQGEQWGSLMFMNDFPLWPTSAVASVNSKSSRIVRQTEICVTTLWLLIYNNWFGKYLMNHIFQLLYWLKNQWVLKQQGLQILFFSHLFIIF